MMKTIVIFILTIFLVASSVYAQDYNESESSGGGDMQVIVMVHGGKNFDTHGMNLSDKSHTIAGGTLALTFLEGKIFAGLDMTGNNVYKYKYPLLTDSLTGITTFGGGEANFASLKIIGGAMVTEEMSKFFAGPTVGLMLGLGFVDEPDVYTSAGMLGLLFQVNMNAYNGDKLGLGIFIRSTSNILFIRGSGNFGADIELGLKIMIKS